MKEIIFFHDEIMYFVVLITILVFMRNNPGLNKWVLS